MQRAVIRALHSPVPDPLAEQDLAEHFEEFLTLQRVPPAAIVLCVSLLRSPAGPRDLSDTAEQPEDSQPPLQPPVVPGPPDPPATPRPVKRQKEAALRTEILGSNPKDRRAQIRATFDPGYCLCRFGKKKLRTLHRLGDCFALPDVDYLDYDFLGTSMPKRSAFDVICQLCAKREIHTAKASASQSSSSSEEVK